MTPLDIHFPKNIVQQHFEDYVKITATDVLLTKQFHCIYSDVMQPFHNIVTYTNSKMINDELILMTINKYLNRGVKNFCWFAQEDKNLEYFDKLLIKNKFKKLTPFSGLMCDLSKQKHIVNIKIPHEMVLMEVSNKDQLKDWTLPFQKNFGYSDLAIDKLFNHYSMVTQNENFQLKHFIVYMKQESIASASLLIKNFIGGFYNLAVLPDYQNCGIGSALQQIRLNYAISHHCKCAVMQATSISEHIAKKLNFFKINNLIPYLYQA